MPQGLRISFKPLFLQVVYRAYLGLTSYKLEEENE